MIARITADGQLLLSVEEEPGEAVETDFYGKRVVGGRLVRGPWAEALSDYAGAALSLVRVEDSSYALDISAATLVSGRQPAGTTAAGPTDNRQADPWT